MDNSNSTTTATARMPMSAVMFEKIWRNEISVVEPEWEDFVQFDLDFGSRRAKISNVYVSEDVTIDGTGFGDPLLHLLLSNCALGHCRLLNTKARAIDIIENSDIISFTIKDSSFENSSIASSRVGGISLINSSNDGSFYILESKITDEIYISSSTIGGIQISESETESFHIYNSKIDNFFVHKNSVIKDIKFSDKSKLTSLSISNSKLKDVRIKNSDTESIIITNCVVNEAIFTYATLRRIEILENSNVIRFRCRQPLQNPSQITLGKSNFGEIDFRTTVFPEFSTMQVSNCQVHNILFDNFCNYGTIFFNSITANKSMPGRPLTTLRISDSDLGKTHFIKCNLQQFDRFEFSNTKMLDVFVAGSQMPNDSAFYLPENEQSPLKMAEQKRLAYGQFKKIYEARGDIAGSLPYLAFEMEAYREQLQMEGCLKNRGELTMLWMNKLSTNYGVSWQRGFSVLFVFWALSYWFFCCLIGYRYENNSIDDWPRFWHVVSYAPYYLNPLRDKDSIFVVSDDSFTSCARILDFASRIVITFLAYQTIQAFRKLGKSSG